MTNYRIMVEEVLVNTINIKANSEEEALKMLEKKYNNKEVALSNYNDFFSVNYEILG